MLLILVSVTSTGYLSSLDENLDHVDLASDANANGGGYCSGTFAMSAYTCEQSGGVWVAEGITYQCFGWHADNGTDCIRMGGSWMPVGVAPSAPSEPTYVDRYPTSCPSGSYGVGSPGTSSFYCEKQVVQTKYITSCPSGMTLVGSGASAYCRQNVETKKDVTVNIGDITNELKGSDFASSTEHNSSLVINNGDANDGQIINGMSGKDNNFVNFTNVPVDGKVTSLTSAWRPEFTVTYKGKVLKAPKPTDATQLQQFNGALSELTSQAGTNESLHSQVEVIAYKVNSIEELGKVTKDKSSLVSLFEKNSSGQYLTGDSTKYSSINKSGFNNYENMVINKEGLYILATKYIDQTKEGSLEDKTTYTFKPIEINFINTLGYLPISNYVVGQVNEMYMSVGLKKKDHGLSNLKYSNDTTEYESMKVPSAHSYTTGYSLIGSTNGGLSLVDPNLNKTPMTSVTFDSAQINVTDIVEYKKQFFVSSDKGISVLDIDSKQLSATSVTSPVLDLEIINETMYALSENKLVVYFIVDRELLPSVKEYDLTGLFSSNNKPGKFEVMGGVISVSTIDEGTDSEVVFLTTK